MVCKQGDLGARYNTPYSCPITQSFVLVYLGLDTFFCMREYKKPQHFLNIIR